MRISQSGIDLLKRFEGLELEAYQDIAGVWTIGYGHTGADVQPGMRITEREAEALLKRDLRSREDAVDRLVSVPLNQNEFDALVSFVYNVGISAFERSTARRRLNRGDRVGAAEALTWWNKATVSGVLRPVTGLTRRRASERALFLTPTNPPLVNDPEALDENSRITPVEDTPRRDSPLESRTVQGAAIAGGAGVASSSMGRDNAEELDQIETNIESGKSMVEDPEAKEGSAPPPGAVRDGAPPPAPDDGLTTELPSENGGSVGDGNPPPPDTETPVDAAPGDCVPASAGESGTPTDAATIDEATDENAAAEVLTDTSCETADAGGSAEDAPIADVDEDGNVSITDGSREDGSVVIQIEERPSKHEVHAVEAQVQLALLILIVLSALFIIYARVDDWRNYRR